MTYISIMQDLKMARKILTNEERLKLSRDLKTLDMEVALMDFLDVRKNIVVPNVSYGLGVHECDILKLSKSGYATEYEIKISRADLRKDFEKGHSHENKKIKNLFYAVPKHLEDYALELVPDTAGIVVINYNRNGTKLLIEQKRDATARVGARKFTEKEINKLLRLGCMRILGLKKNIQKRV